MENKKKNSNNKYKRWGMLLPLVVYFLIAIVAIILTFIMYLD